MALRDECSKLNKELAGKLSQEFLDAKAQLIEQLRAKHAELEATHEGDMIPEFTLQNYEHKDVSSAYLLSQGPLVISFYRGTWCPFCSLELKALHDALPRIRELGANVVAISPQQIPRDFYQGKQNPYSFHLLYDIGARVSHNFGLSFNLTEDYAKQLTPFVDLKEANGEVAANQLVMPATYVVDQSGRVVKSYVDADYTKRMDMEEILQALEKLS